MAREFSNRIPLGVNLANEDQKKSLDTIFQRWIEDDKAIHSKYVDEWNSIDEFLDGERQLQNFSTDYSKDLDAQNDPTTGKQRQKSFAAVNRARPNHESVLGDFIAQPLRLSLKGRNPDDRNRALVLKSRIEYIEDVEMIPENVYFPAMDCAWPKGLHWIKIHFNPYANNLRGKFEVEEISCRDVLVDSSSRGYFFRTAMHFEHRFRRRLDEAASEFSKYPLFNAEEIGADTEYDEGYVKTELQTNDYATFYEIQFKQKVQHYYSMFPEQPVKEIGEQEFLAFSSPQEPTAEFVFPGEEEDQYFIALYHQTVGTFYLQRSPVSDFTLIPLANIFTPARLYPMGDGKIAKPLYDLLDVLVTVALENAKRSNIPIAGVEEDIEGESLVSAENALKHGGIVKGLKSLHFGQQINPAIANLIPAVVGWIQDIVSKHAASMGELPARQIAKETVQALMAKDRQSHGRKDMMLRWTLTRFVKVMVRMITLFDTEEDFILVKDMKPGGVTHIPINQTWSEGEYLMQLAKLGELQLPQGEDPREAEQFERALAKLRKKFESENDVKQQEMPGFYIENQDFTENELVDFMQQSGLTGEDIKSRYAVRQGTVIRFVVNDLSQDVDLNIRYGTETDYKNDPEFRFNRAMMMRRMNAISLTDMLKDMDIEDVDQRVENLKAESEVTQIAQEIADDPNLMAIMQQAIASAKAQGVEK